MNGKIKIKNQKIPQFFYCIYLFWYLMSVILQTNITKINENFWNAVNEYFDVFILIFLVGQIIYIRHYSLNQFFLIVLVSLVMLAISICSKSNILFASWIFIIASKNLDFYKLFQKLFIIQIISVFSVLFLFFVGAINQTMILRDARLRMSLGYVHPNYLGFSIALIFVLNFARKKKITVWDYILTILAVIFIWVVPNSQSSAFMLVILIVILPFYNYIETKGLRLKNIVLNICILCTFAVNVCSIFLMIYYNGKSWSENLNRIFSGRLWFGHSAYLNFGINLLGQDISKLDWLTLDNAYMSLLIRYGIMGYSIFTIVYLATMKYMKFIDSRMVIIMFAFSMYGCMESGFIGVGGNVFLLFIGMLLYKRKSITKSY